MNEAESIRLEQFRQLKKEIRGQDTWLQYFLDYGYEDGYNRQKYNMARRW